MSDWKKRTDEKVRREEERKRDKAGEFGRKASESMERAEAKYTYKYRCHVCGKLPDGFAMVTHQSGYSTPDLEKPKGVFECSWGNHWVCYSSDCSSSGVCVKCATGWRRFFH